MRNPQVTVHLSGHFQLQQWALLRYRNPTESGTQEGRTYRGEAAEWDEAAAAAADVVGVVVVVVVDDVAAAAAGQKPVGTGAAWLRTEPEPGPGQPAAGTWAASSSAAAGGAPAAAAEAGGTAAQPVGTGGIGVAVHLHVVAALLVVVGGDVVVVVVAAVDAGHQAVAAAGLGAADCWAGAAWMAAQSQGWELSGRC